MKKKLKIHNSQVGLYRADGDQPQPGTNDQPQPGANNTNDGSASGGFSWNGFFDSFFGNAGGILDGVSGIVGAANNKNTTNTTTVTYDTSNRNFFSWSNGTTITAIVIGGVAIVITLILVLKK